MMSAINSMTSGIMSKPEYQIYNRREVMKGARLITLLALAWACFATQAQFVLASASAQNDIRVSMTVDAGFNSYLKENAWALLRITLVNSGDPIEGQVVITDTQAGSAVRYAQPVSLGRNARRTVTLYVPATSDAYEVRLVSGEQVIAAVVPVVRELAPGDRLVLIASDPPDAFNFIGDVRAPSGSTSALAFLRTDQFPDYTFALDSADVIVFDNVDTAALTDAQRDAIKQWVMGGGHLILTGGPNAQLALSGFSDIAPARVNSALINTSSEALAALAAPAAIEPVAPAPTQTVTAVRLEMAAGNVRTLAGSAETPLIMRREVGRGIVDQLAFDPALAPLRDWGGRAALFSALLGGRVGIPNDAGLIGEGADASVAAAALTAASPPSALVVGGFFALYVLVIGPLNFVLLRRMRRQSWAWFTVPTIVIGFTLLGLLTGFRLRGNNPHVHRLSVTLGDAALADARAFNVFGLFSPRRVDVEFDTGRALAQDVVTEDAPANAQPPQPITIITGDPGRIEQLPLTNSEVRTIYTRGSGVQPTITSALQFLPGSANTAAAVGGKITNTSAFPLANCVLLAGKDYQAIGNLSPGASADVKLSLLMGHPQTLANLRSINAVRDRLNSGRTYGYGSAGRSSKPSSAGATPNTSGGSQYPFEQIGPSTTDALVNWQNFADEPIRQDAMFGLVATVFGADAVGSGVYLGCWESRDDTGAQVEGADYTDRGLRVWRLTVQGHLVQKGEILPPDVFTWNTITTSSSTELNDNGLSFEPGQHIVALTPWLDLRTDGITSTVALNVEFDTNSTGLSGLRDTTIELFNWQTRAFEEVVNDASDLAGQNTHTGPYLSPAGQIVMKLNALSESVVLNRLATSVMLSEE
jgi:hypothetical protein